MKNPFKRFRPAAEEPPTVTEAPEPAVEAEPEPVPEVPKDSFTEWCRSQIRGGIERRERNDIFEAYSVYGVDGGRLTCRYYHRYPEHEREFDLSDTRALSFNDFNRRLLSELDRGDLRLAAYNDCIEKAVALADSEAPAPACAGFSDNELTALKDFCNSADTLKNQSYLHSDGVLSCDCESVVGEESLTVRFRKPLPFDALNLDIAGVKREPIGGYDIDNMWVMGVYNRLAGRCSCKVLRLTSEWSLESESVYLITAEGFPGVEGMLLVAVAPSDSFRRFGFYSLDFANK